MSHIQLAVRLILMVLGPLQMDLKLPHLALLAPSPPLLWFSPSVPGQTATILTWATAKLLLALELTPTVTNVRSAVLKSTPGLAHTTPEWAQGKILLALGLACTTRT